MYFYFANENHLEPERKDYITVDWDLIDSLAYQTQLKYSLKRELSKFDQVDLLEEVFEVLSSLSMNPSYEQIPFEKRIKSKESTLRKYKSNQDKHRNAEKVFNDLLGIRIIVDSYDDIEQMDLPEGIKIVDLREGKSQDDGYRAIHLYYQKTHWYYPIEIQIMTKKDQEFNNWQHIFLYKNDNYNKEIGAYLRKLYEQGIINSIATYKKELDNVSSEEI